MYCVRNGIDGSAWSWTLLSGPESAREAQLSLKIREELSGRAARWGPIVPIMIGQWEDRAAQYGLSFGLTIRRGKSRFTFFLLAPSHRTSQKLSSGNGQCAISHEFLIPSFLPSPSSSSYYNYFLPVQRLVLLLLEQNPQWDMVKVRMNTADVAAEVKCLRRLIGMRCSNVYDLTPKVLASFYVARSLLVPIRWLFPRKSSHHRIRIITEDCFNSCTCWSYF